MEKITNTFLSVGIFLHKLNHKHIKILFHVIGHSLPSETTCRKTMLQLRADESQRIRKAVQDKQIFSVVDESTLSGIQNINILAGSLETPHGSYLCDCQPPHVRQIATALL